MNRTAETERRTEETEISARLSLDREDRPEVATGIAFFDHMLTLLAAHGHFGLSLRARGDLEVDFHHTVEDVGLVLGDALHRALGERKGIRRYGHAVVPMDEALAAVTIDLSNRPFLVYRVPDPLDGPGPFNVHLGKEFFRAFAVRAGMTLHIHLQYGENEHHMLEAIFKAAGRALDAATAVDPRVAGVQSTKGVL